MYSISIIIATYNAEKYLQNCLNSIIKQLEHKIELIIIDGGSKDNTIEIIKNKQNYINYWISETDKGIYDAWNKGIKVAKGEWIMFLGADDKLLPGSLKKYLRYIDNLTEPVEYISSRLQMVDKESKIIRVKGWPWKWPDILKETMTAHPGSLHSRSLFENYGLYNTEYKIVGDTELLLRAKGFLRYSFMNEITVEMQEGGTSDSLNAVWERYKANIKTGECNKLRAFKYALVVSTKFILKKNFRKFGFNIYLKK